MLTRLLRQNKRYFSSSLLRKQMNKKESIIYNRKKFLSPSLATFEAYDEPMIVDRGEKQYLFDIDGEKYIDLLGQNLCISVGYNRSRINNAVFAQMEKLQHATTMYYNEQSCSLAKELVEKIPKRSDGEDWVVHFVNSGSDAVDLAIQMARVYTGRPETISLNKAYHGLQGYAAGVTAIGTATQDCYGSMFPGVRHVNANNLDELEHMIQFGTGGKLGCFIAEPVQGYGGIHSLDDNYLQEAFAMVNATGGVTIADEVQSGMCRTGETWWGFENEHHGNVEPDMITMAKGLGNGYGIIGAVVSKRSIADAFCDKMWFNTYGGNPIACVAAREVLNIMDDEKVLDNCRKQGKLLNARVSKLCEAHPDVYKEIRGTGMFQGLEVYGDTPEESQQNAYSIHKDLLNYGVIAGRGSATKNVLRLQPPMIIEEQDILNVVDALDNAAIKFKNQNNL
jgi:alanine-glyoxylate transaminase / (R)-3-amino-2-methylpropionate-pyruvate transaminase